jgi:hypothetical protein
VKEKRKLLPALDLLETNISRGENGCPGVFLVGSWGDMPLEMLATHTFAEVLGMIPKCGEDLGKKCRSGLLVIIGYISVIAWM